jgi:hypothetical protein
MSILLSRRGVLSSGGPEFAPDSLPGMVFWVRAKDIAQANNTAVAAWEDRSAFNNDAVQASGLSRPTFFNTHSQVAEGKAVRFGAAIWLECGGDAELDLSAWTIACVFQRQISGFGALAEHSDGLAVNWSAIFAANTSYLQYFNGTYQSINAAAPALNTWASRIDRCTSAGVCSIRQDGSQVASGDLANPLITASNTLRLGHYRVGSTGYLQGDIAELIVYNQSHSDEDILELESYLEAEHALP